MRKVISSLIAAAALLVLTTAASAQVVKMETTEGTVLIELNPEAAPKTVANFLRYTKSGHYTGLIFHRVIKGFMIQGGGFTAKLKQRKTRGPIKLEAGRGLSNERGTIAMARTSVQDSAKSQFFINHGNNARLDNYGGGYAVFGRVIEGMDVVDAIAQIPTKRQGRQANLPTTPVIIKKMSIVGAKASTRPSRSKKAVAK